MDDTLRKLTFEPVLFQNELMKSSFLSKYEQKLSIFVYILGETMTSEIHSEIYWPLAFGKVGLKGLMHLFCHGRIFLQLFILKGKWKTKTEGTGWKYSENLGFFSFNGKIWLIFNPLLLCHMYFFCQTFLNFSIISFWK